MQIAFLLLLISFIGSAGFLETGQWYLEKSGNKKGPVGPWV
jgi:hypothetical protein